MNQLNVFGKELELCCSSPVTGAYRDGYCNTGINDIGTHTVCAVVTDKFLEFSKSKGNDLTTANPYYNFEGLKALLGAPAAQGLDLERGLSTNNATPLSLVSLGCDLSVSFARLSRHLCRSVASHTVKILV